MLIALLLVLSAVKVNGESVDHDGLRRSRQLDLGLQDIRTTDEEIPSTIPTVQNDDQTPSSLLGEAVSTQSHFDFKSVNSAKGSELSESKIPKPSSDLVPPFNDLEQELATKVTFIVDEVKTTIANQNKFVTTTEKLFFKEPSTQNIRISKNARSGAELNNAEATNELRSYLPPQPEFSAAAQTNVAVVQPANQNNDHDHHHGHHHHGDNFDICSDAFHSFLCAPLKARKRITGAFPSNLRGQSSFINYQKALPNPDRETAPSNTFRSEYLPPNPSPTNLLQSTYITPSTTFRPTTTTFRPTTTTTRRTTTARPYSPPAFVPESSNSNDRFYLPPDNRLFNPVTVKPFPSNQVFSTLKPSTIPSPTTTQVSSTPPTTTAAASPSTIQTVTTISSNVFPSSQSGLPSFPVFDSFSSNENGFYLPPKSNPQPAASFASTPNYVFPISSTQQPSTIVSLPVVTGFDFAPSNPIFVSQSIVEQQPTFPVFTTTAKPVTSIPTTTFKPFNQFSSFASQPSNPGGSYLPPIPQFQPSPISVITTVKPTTTTVKPTTPKLVPQPSNADRSYLPPDPKEPAAAQISSAAVAPPQSKNPFHHGRDLCTDPFHSFLCTSAKPRKRITGQLPSGFKPESSNRNELRLRPEPSSQEESKVLPENVGYKYPKPVNPIPTPSNSIISSTQSAVTGYSYPKPEKVFPLPSQQDFKIAPVTTTTTKKPEPTFQASEAKVVGYEYKKPDKIFPLPGSQESTKVITTTVPPTTGYSYPKPQRPFALPTEQKQVQQKPPQPQATNQVVGYQYPKPEQSLKLPEKKGYSYPKPEKRLELPTESRSKGLLPQTNSSLDALKNLGSADFIPVNKIDFKRSESSKLIAGLRRFGERMKRRERETQLLKRH